MANQIRKIAILTAGGDCPGLNAAIRAVVRTAILKYGWEVVGSRFGYRGLYKNDFIPLTLDSISGILHKGGSILYNSNKDNLFDYLVEENGKMVKKDVSYVGVENLKKQNVDALVIVGGDSSLISARDFYDRGVNVVGIPKTIDNDLLETDVNIGFHTAVDIATEALSRLHTTAESHHRVALLEVMGRDAGFIALEAGVGGSADIILIPEIPYDLDKIVEKINQRKSQSKPFTIICVSEGAKPVGGSVFVGKIVEDSPIKERLGGIGNKIASDLEKLLPGQEVRCTTLGHLQRGGDSAPFDRVLATRYGVKAADMVAAGEFGRVAILKENKITSVELDAVAGKSKSVDVNSDLVQAARSIGISFGD